MSKYKVAIVAGSLRKDSYSEKLGKVFINMFSDEFAAELVSIDDLALYNPDLETDDAPVRWSEFRESIKAADAVLFIAPEYNRSMPAALKNAIDVGSQPQAENVWFNKPGAVVSIGAGTIGGFGAAHHLRQTVVYLNMLLMQSPEAYVAGIHSVFDENGNVAVKSTQDFLQKVIDAFEAWVKKLA